MYSGHSGNTISVYKQISDLFAEQFENKHPEGPMKMISQWESRKTHSRGLRYALRSWTVRTAHTCHYQKMTGKKGEERSRPTVTICNYENWGLNAQNIRKSEMKSTNFLDVTLCNLIEVFRRFRSTYSPPSAPYLLLTGYLLSLLFHPED
jgi:hypothetical protein